jgi:hypothetical protein
MIMVARVVMISASDVMWMAILGVKGAVIGLGGHRARPVLDRLNGRGNRKRQGHHQAGTKRPDPCPSR